jgi:hypothetical protein
MELFAQKVQRSPRSDAVTKRRHELAVRLALGASHGGVLRVAMREGAVLVALGLLLGVPGVLFAGACCRASSSMSAHTTPPPSWPSVSAWGPSPCSRAGCRQGGCSASSRRGRCARSGVCAGVPARCGSSADGAGAYSPRRRVHHQQQRVDAAMKAHPYTLTANRIAGMVQRMNVTACMAVALQAVRRRRRPLQLRQAPSGPPYLTSGRRTDTIPQGRMWRFLLRAHLSSRIEA